MGLAINGRAPDCEAGTVHGRTAFHDWAGEAWPILFIRPRTSPRPTPPDSGTWPGCGGPGLDHRNVKIIGVSVDTAGDHNAWAAGIEEVPGPGGSAQLSDRRGRRFTVSKLHGMLPTSGSGDAGTRTLAGHQAIRNIFDIGPGAGADENVKLVLVQRMDTGCNRDEALRVRDPRQLTASVGCPPPTNVGQGEYFIVSGPVSNDRADEILGAWTQSSPDVRIVPQPGRAAVSSCPSSTVPQI
ncbi:MAG: hypothetical protein L0H41_13550 [Microlunatus sp.]|nr:hypothetical protein [Microlunatus sp.]